MEPDTFPLTSNLSVHNEGGNDEQYGIKLAVSIYDMFNIQLCRVDFWTNGIYSGEGNTTLQM